MVAEGLQPGDEALGFAAGVGAAAGVVGAEVVIGFAGGQDVPVALCPPWAANVGPAGVGRQGLGWGGQSFCCWRTRWRALCLAGS